jgi:tetrahydromethanopterin S-methyltransferase subunit G
VNLVAVLQDINNRLENINNRLENLNNNLNERMDNIDERLDDIDERLRTASANIQNVRIITRNAGLKPPEDSYDPLQKTVSLLQSVTS